MDQDIRWIQRFYSFQKALAQQIANAVITSYVTVFEELLLKMHSLLPGENE